MLFKYFPPFFASTFGLFQKPFRRTIAFLICVSVAGCAVYEERRHLNMIGQTMGEANVELDGTAYHVEFIPLLGGTPANPDALVGDPFSIFDSGTPTVAVRRNDNTSLEARHYQAAINVAAKACLNNPKWNIGNSRAAMAKYHPMFSPTPGALKGRGFLKNGQWYLFDACE